MSYSTSYVCPEKARIISQVDDHTDSLLLQRLDSQAIHLRKESAIVDFLIACDLTLRGGTVKVCEGKS